QKLQQVLFKIRDILRGRVPGGGLVVMKEAAVLDALAIPVDPRILQRPGGEVVHQSGQTFLTAEAVKESQLALGLGGLGLAGAAFAGGLGSLDFLFPSPFT